MVSTSRCGRDNPGSNPGYSILFSRINFEFRYGTEPNTYYYECTHIRTTGTYAMQWIDMSCSSSYPAICQFFPSGQNPIPPKPILPNKGGCKPGWWKYGGYCYKDFGFSTDFDKEGTGST